MIFSNKLSLHLHLNPNLMRALRPFRPIILARPLSLTTIHTTNIKNYTTMPGNTTTKEKKPQLTHFLCLPLVNSTSLPQLETSLATFKASIPLSPHQHPNPRAPTQPLIPDGALRPIGTLHLTLGVMSLTTPERLDDALQFFHSLDLAAMAREAEAIASKHKDGKGTKIQQPASAAGSDLVLSTGAPRPFTISLESLHALPRARAATVLHAAPVDATSRLYPFCEMLRNKFLEAGFLVGEYKGKDPNRNNGQASNERQESNLNPDKPACEELAAENAPTHLPLQPSQIPARTPKPRPLLLHATVVNTIYVKGRRRGPGSGDRNHRTTRYMFDARDLLAQYRDYYLDSLRTEPRARQVVSASGEEAGDGSGEESKNQAEEVVPTADKYPFAWAREFPLESICICEMGAKKLQADLDTDPTGMDHRLGEKYTVVSERSLGFASDASNDGGVGV